MTLEKNTDTKECLVFTLKYNIYKTQDLIGMPFKALIEYCQDVFNEAGANFRAAWYAKNLKVFNMLVKFNGIYRNLLAGTMDSMQCRYEIPTLQFIRADDQATKDFIDGVITCNEIIRKVLNRKKSAKDDELSLYFPKVDSLRKVIDTIELETKVIRYVDGSPFELEDFSPAKD